MGGALLRGLAAKKIFSRISVVEPAPDPALADLAGVSWVKEWPLEESADVVMFAVKPQAMEKILPSYGGMKNALYVSIAAGVTLSRLAHLLGSERAAIVRSMPNLPASIGQGATVAVANAHVTEAQKILAQNCLSAAGLVMWAEDEAMLDTVTALSGSGPAYVFALCEMMARVGTEMGLPPAMAAVLARQTIVGSGALLAAAPETAEDLRRAVTSPKGTTEAALVQWLADDGLHVLLTRTMKAAAERSRELAST